MSGAVTYHGRDFVLARDRQRKRALDLYGQDEFASAIEPRGSLIPKTSAPYALEVARSWMAMAPPCVEKAIEGSSAGALVKVAAYRALEALKVGNLAPEAEVKFIGQEVPLAADILRSLGGMFFGIASANSFPFSFTSDGGHPVMAPTATRLFWDSCGRVAIACGGTDASVTADERWEAFVEGAREGAINASRVAGEVAGKIAATAGQALGAGVGGFFGELGVVNVVIVGAGIYVATRIL